MSLLNTIKVKLGISSTQSNNFELQATPDGELKLTRSDGSEVFNVLADNILRGVHPPQFDNSKKLATTGFAQRALGNLQNAINTDTSITIPASAVGSIVNLYGTNGGVVTLPSSTSVPVGATIEFFSSSTQPFTVQRVGADVIYVASSVTSFVLNAGDTLRVVNLGAGVWVTSFSSAQMQYSPKFGASLSTSGYQKLPSGLIIQWGINLSSTSDVAVIFPISFPTAIRSLTFGTIASDSGAFACHNGVGASGFNLAAWSAASTRTTVNVNWIAIGH